MLQPTHGHSTAAAVLPSPSRRSLVGAGAALLLGSVAAAAAAHGAPVASPGGAGDDAELIALARDYAAANAEIRRLEPLADNHREDEVYELLDARRHVARERGAQLSAATVAGLLAKATIIADECDLLGGPIESGSLADLAETLARDLLRITAAAPTAQIGDDADLIATCHAFLAADETIAVTSAAEWEDEAVAAALDGPWYSALERLTAIPARTPAGVRAKANAAYIALKSTGCGREGRREEAAALAALADLTGRAAA